MIYSDFVIDGSAVLYKKQDVSHRLVEFLFETVSFVKFPTLAQVIEWIGKNPELLLVYRRDYINELYQEALKGPIDPVECGEDDAKLDYLELYATASLNSRSKTIEHGFSGHFDLHAKSVPIAKDGQYYKQGEIIDYSVSMTNIRELLHLEVRVNPNIFITEGNLASNDYGLKTQELIGASITLGQFIRGIFWELSWHGGPEEQQEVKEMLEARVEEAQAAEAEEGEGLGEYTENIEIFYSLGARKFDKVFDNIAISDWLKSRIIEKVRRFKDENSLLTQTLVVDWLTELSCELLQEAKGTDKKRLKAINEHSVIEDLSKLSSVLIKQELVGLPIIDVKELMYKF